MTGELLPESSESVPIILHSDDLQENIDLIKEIGPLNGIEDLTSYSIGYSILVTEDLVNYFHGGHTLFDEDNPYNPEESKICEEKVKRRMDWIVGFEYTPEELRKEIKDFQNWFVDQQVYNQQVWEEAVNKWISIRKKIHNEVLKDKKIKYAYDYYQEAERKLTRLNIDRIVKSQKQNNV